MRTINRRGCREPAECTSRRAAARGDVPRKVNPLSLRRLDDLPPGVTTLHAVRTKRQKRDSSNHADQSGIGRESVLKKRKKNCALESRNISKMRCHHHSLKSEIEQYHRTAGR
jgi:hypothetical protein